MDSAGMNCPVTGAKTPDDRIGGLDMVAPVSLPDLKDGPSGPDGNGRSLSPAVIRSVAYIKEHYHEPISLAEVAAWIDLAPNYFSQRFKIETGENFIDFLKGIRLRRAQVLLKSSDLKVAEIAAQVGYPNPNYFCRIFKDLTGETPAEYRMHRSA